MKKSILIVTCLLLVVSCQNKYYYKYIVKASTQDRIGPNISYFTSFKLKDDSLHYEYVMLIESFKMFVDLNINTKGIEKQLEKGELELQLNDLNFDLSPYRIISTDFIDSLNGITTNEILSKYFEKGVRLRTEEIPLKKVKEIIYVLVKRKQYIYAYFPGENSVNYALNIFYGKLKYRHNCYKMYNPIDEFINVKEVDDK